MKIATKALLTMVVIAMLALGSVPVSALGSNQVTGVSRQLDRLQQRHDRKLELRADLLGMSPSQLKDQLKVKSFNQILKEHGFNNRQAYYKALLGKVKEELAARGWSDKKIQNLLQKRTDRLKKSQPDSGL